MATITQTAAIPAKSSKRVDYTQRWLGVAAAYLSVCAYFYFYAQGVSLAYSDAISHLDIARRVFDSSTTGLAQLAGAWLPLPHILAIPLSVFDTLYYTGFAGSIISMLSYVVASILLYKITWSLTRHKMAAIVTAAVFMLNPNVLYMQSTPMTELLLFAGIAGMVYGLQQWIITDNHRYLIGCGVAALIATLTRYESWVLLAIMSVIVVYVAYRKKYTRKRMEGTAIAFVYVAYLGIASWMLVSLLIFGNFLYFQTGDYSKPSLWVGANEPAVGDWWIAFMTYSYAVLDNLWPIIVVLMVVGLVVMAVKERLAMKILPILSMSLLFPFFVIALYLGQRPLHVAQINGDMYNVRFGLLMILPAALAIGYLVSILPERKHMMPAAVSSVAIILVAFAFGGLATNESIATLKEPANELQKSSTVTTEEVSNYLAANHRGGRILIESFGNNTILFNAQVSLRDRIYEGSYRLWEPALKDPVGSNIQWIVMRHEGNVQPDKVYLNLYGTDALKSYEQVFANNGYYIYERRTS